MQGAVRVLYRFMLVYAGFVLKLVDLQDAREKLEEGKTVAESQGWEAAVALFTAGLAVKG